LQDATVAPTAASCFLRIGCRCVRPSSCTTHAPS